MTPEQRHQEWVRDVADWSNSANPTVQIVSSPDTLQAMDNPWPDEHACGYECLQDEHEPGTPHFYGYKMPTRHSMQVRIAELEAERKWLRAWLLVHLQIQFEESEGELNLGITRFRLLRNDDAERWRAFLNV